MSSLQNGLILLLVTALVSGVFAPFVVNRIQAKNQERLKVFEADVARQSKIIEEQAALITRMSTVLWEFQLTLIAPLYYGQPGLRRGGTPRETQSQDSLPDPSREAQMEPYKDAAKNYLANAGRILGTIRAEIGGAVRLVPARQSKALRDLYYQELLHLDLKVTRLITQGPTGENEKEWQTTQSYILSDLAVKLDSVVDELAEALGLKYQEQGSGK
jgi:hypothetical protein